MKHSGTPDCAFLSPDRRGTPATARRSLGCGHTADACIPLLRGGHHGRRVWLVGISADRSAVPVGWARYLLAVHRLGGLAAADAGSTVSGLRRPLRQGCPRLACWMFATIPDRASRTWHLADLDRPDGAHRDGLEPADPCPSQSAIARRIQPVRGDRRDRSLVRPAVHQSALYPQPCARAASAPTFRSPRSNRCHVWPMPM